MRPSRVFVAASLLAPLCASAACRPADDAPPLDRPAYPTGLALVPGGEHLLVVSSNFDLTYRLGTVLAVDIERVDAALQDGDADSVVTNAFTSAVEVPSFGDRPAVTSRGERAFVAARGDNVLFELGVQGGQLTCTVAELPEGAAEGDVPRCGRPPSVMTFVGGNDPFHVAVTSETRDDGDELVRVDGVMTALTAPAVQFWRANLLATNDARLEGAGQLQLGDGVVGLRGLAILPTSAGPIVFTAAERARDALRGRGVDLVHFPPSTRATPVALDLTATTGSLSAREMAVIPSADGVSPPTSLLVTLRNPDAIARIDTTTLPDGTTRARVGGVQSSCDDPSKVSVVRLDPDGTPDNGDEVVRALVACFGDDAILALDPDTLSTTDAIRFLGRGPYDVVVDPDHAPPRAYVSFFSESTVGVLDLVVDGEARMVARGKIAEPRPRPETGRE